MALVEAAGLIKEYGQGQKTMRVLDGIDLTINEGEFVAIVGPSGCGKSTFLHIAGGFVPATRGGITFDGAPVTKPGPDRGVVFQDYSLYPWRTVFGNIVWGLEAQGVARATRIETAERFMEMVGLTAFRNHYPSELSGGMKQRVALARTLTFDPKLLLMDEPFGALDVQTRELMQEELQRIWDATRKTVLFVTHDIDEAVYLSDRVLVFTARPGKIKEAVAIDLQRPRAIEIKRTPAYAEYRNRIWDLLRQEVLQAAGQEA
jgi:NitT/TauT family transport system ATP-binding protein